MRWRWAARAASRNSPVEVTKADTRVRGLVVLRSEELRDNVSPPRYLFHGPGESLPVIGEGSGVIFEIDPRLAEDVDNAGETAEMGERLSP